MRADAVAMVQRLDEAETRIGVHEDENEHLQQMAKKSAKECAELWDSVSDMINRERHMNLRLTGLKDKFESGNLRECVRLILSEALGVDIPETELQFCDLGRDLSAPDARHGSYLNMVQEFDGAAAPLSRGQFVPVL
ncbi:LINE-1 type transposase domain-containing 1 [Labeo rohita]|uniref:LINE-1 type transposase domain-containing 1 n=1 Tax=Labeo rohita TaxID=84645 RepID=A0A498MC68_LABRO|nr:LINE-1 type transposase domain-containing 1 [Labeo rohita]